MLGSLTQLSLTMSSKFAVQCCVSVSDSVRHLAHPRGLAVIQHRWPSDIDNLMAQVAHMCELRDFCYSSHARGDLELDALRKIVESLQGDVPVAASLTSLNIGRVNRTDFENGVVVCQHLSNLQRLTLMSCR